MKTKTILISLLMAMAFTFIQCGGKKNDHSENGHGEAAAEQAGTEPQAPAEAMQPQFAVDSRFQEQLSTVFSAYILLKEALVTADASKIGVEATATTKSLAGADMKLLSGPAHNDWMTYLNGMETSLNTIASSSDIEVQRQAFSTVTENLYKSIKAYGLGGATAYYDFCPMAFNNQGGFWLSDAEEIRNPYFGDQMLTCGSVKEKLK